MPSTGRPPGPSVNDARQRTSLTVQVKTQVKIVQVLKHSAGNAANGALSHLGKDGIAQFLHAGGRTAGNTIYTSMKTIRRGKQLRDRSGERQPST
jgi:hypothetical protein